MHVHNVDWYKLKFYQAKKAGKLFDDVVHMYIMHGWLVDGGLDENISVAMNFWGINLMWQHCQNIER